MSRRRRWQLTACAGLAVLMAAACGKVEKADPAAEAPPANTQVEHVGDSDTVKVDHADQFPVVVAAKYDVAPELNVTGTVAPDVSRAIPVISLASGRVLEVHAKLGDTVTKGQLLMRVQSSDISGAFSDYRQAVADQTLARTQLERAKILLDKGAIAQKDYEVAANTAEKTNVTVENTVERIKVLGADVNQPSSIIEIYAPISGVVTDQQTNAAAGVQGLASPNPFTISDLSSVWIVCDVFENDLKSVRLGEYASVRLNAYPDQVYSGRIANIGPVLDPATRAAKVRLEMKNPGNMRVGMFVTATFRGAQKTVRAAVPASAILHLHDRDWVYVPAGDNAFRRVEVTGGAMLPSKMQEVLSGIAPGERIVSNALVLQNSTSQ
jgi:cobalt-zinc-cadmium efflux system membrane fusion protein